MTELELIIDLHKGTDRQGPGSKEDTLKALSFVDLPQDRVLKVADLGCGSGGQTITLAENLNADVAAVDLFSPFLEELDKRAEEAGVHDRVRSLEQSIDDLKFPENSLDLIWSEGAIYNIGFENGIKLWKDYLRPGGYLAVSEITWITGSRPKEVEDFWNQAYPEIDSASNKISLLEENGYSLAGYFYLSEASWLKQYYAPLEKRFASFLEAHDHSELAAKVVEDNKSEIDLYKKYKAYYSYGFYVAKKDM